MQFPFVKKVYSEAETENVAGEFSKIIKPGDVIALKGNLGSGKTFFVKKVCKNYGINNVTSPSFAIINQYQNSLLINHFDFYRIKKEEELFDIGFEEYINNQGSITFIEWADLMNDILPSKRFEISFTVMSEEQREIRIEKR